MLGAQADDLLAIIPGGGSFVGGSMRCIVAGILFVVALSGGLPATLSAQQDEVAQQQKALEVEQLWGRLQKKIDPAERIGLDEQAVKLWGEPVQWTLSIAREEARARLWWYSGDGYAETTVGDKAENVERAIAAYNRALSYFGRERSAQEWASLQYKLGLAYVARR